MSSVQVIAHRGASAYAPENTQAAFDLALDMGADALETDVRLTRDGVLVLCHDSSVDRISNGHGQVAAFTLDELRRLDFGAWFAECFAGERVLTLEEFLALYAHRCHLVIEIKEPGLEEKLLSLVTREGLLRGVVFTSFLLECLDNVRRLEPQASLGYLTHCFDEPTIELARLKNFAQICPRGAHVSPELVRQAHLAGLVVRAWGISSDEIQEHALQAGVDGMTVNWPDRLIRRLHTLGRRRTKQHLSAPQGTLRCDGGKPC